ncbi:RDD family protein [Cellulomonas sp. JZ18]|uniref:RDD family protein n=1 Tax=Cellulomonas sp. JZ18 TaxID=2654191 RepID=UPI0018AFB1D0|nr:RDD family protein [Cellulomonas sp. JZ18]
MTDTPASLGRRFLAVAVDQVLVGLLTAPFTVEVLRRALATTATDDAAVVVAPVGVGALLGLGVATAVSLAQWVLHGRYGWTLGRRLLGVRTVDVHSRRPIGVLRVLLRGLVVAAGTLACLVGQVAVLASPALDRTGRNRGWHDRAVDAEVLRALPAASTAGHRDAHAARAVRGRGDGTGHAPDGSGGSGDGRTGTPGWAALAEPGTAPPDAATSGPGAAVRGTVPATRPAGPVASRGTVRAADVPATTGSLVLPPLDPPRAAPDLDTRALPLVRAGAAAAPGPSAPVDEADEPAGLAPELELTRPAPPRPDVVPAPRRAAARGLRVALDDGRTLTVERVALLGRNPSPAPGVQVVRVTDPERSVSKTHLELGADASGAWVTDRGSTNGTVVTLPDGAQVVCRVDHPVRLRPGSVVVFGDRSLRVVATPGSSVADVLRDQGAHRAQDGSPA